MSKAFNEFDRERCNHCGKWDKWCSLQTFPIEIEHYGEFAICKKCLSEHDTEYWTKWVKRKLKIKNESK